MPPKKLRPKREVVHLEEAVKGECKEEDKSLACRVCLREETESGASLFAARGDSLLHHCVSAVANVRIAAGDGLPSRVCAPCLAELDAAVAFKLKCESTDRILHNNLEIKEECQDPETEDFFCEDYRATSYEVPVVAKIKGDYDDVKLNIDNIEVVSKEKAGTELECHDCGEKFRTKCKLRVHWKKQHLPLAYICEHCKRVFKSAKAYQKHKNMKNCAVKLVNMRVEGLGKERTFCCTKCSYSTKHSRNFSFHTAVHTKLKEYKCDMCDSAFSQTSSLQSHKEFRHKIYKKEITCEFCGKLLKGRTNIYRHLLRHSNVKKYQCDYCKKFLKTKTSLLQHLLRHGEKTLCCEICSKSFYTSPELNYHKNYVHYKKKKPVNYVWHTCDICGFRTQNKYKINNHRTKHSATNHACNICGFFFQKEVLYKNHMERHKIGKVLPCPYCELTYSTKDAVRGHIKKKHYDKNQPITICKVEMGSDSFMASTNKT